MIKIAFIELKKRVGVRALHGNHNMETIFDPLEYRSGEVDLNISKYKLQNRTLKKHTREISELKERYSKKIKQLEIQEPPKLPKVHSGRANYPYQLSTKKNNGEGITTTEWIKRNKSERG